MKRISLLLSILLLAGIFTACGGERAASAEEPPAAGESQSEPEMIPLPVPEPPEPKGELEPEEVPEASSQPEDPSQPEPEMISKAESAPPPASPFPDAPLVIRVVDEAGRPVAHVSGALELGVATPDSSPPAVGLKGGGESQLCTGQDGKLYFTDPADLLPRQGSLLLSAHFDSSIRQKIPLDLSASPGEMAVTWTGALPPARAPDPASRRITFLLLDQEGNPVAGVSGGLEQVEGGTVGYRPLGGGEGQPASDGSGRLYLDLEPGFEQREKSRKYRLILQGHYDGSLRQTHTLELVDPPGSYTITWKQPLPPRERPAQTAGIRIFMVDAGGKPVAGVELGGSPYPKETTGDIPAIAMMLGPSDRTGYIRWESVQPGTYELYGSRDGKSQAYEIKMPNNKTMVDVTLTWNPS